MDKNTFSVVLNQNLETVKTFTEMMVSNISKEISDLRSENSDLHRSLEFSQSEIEMMKRQVSANSTTAANKASISDFCNLPSMVGHSAFRAGKSSADNKPRLRTIKLPSVPSKVYCFRASSKLNGTQTYLSNDVSVATVEICHEKLYFHKEKGEERYIAYHSGTSNVCSNEYCGLR